MEFRANEHLRLSAGGRNLLDKDYELAWGYPEPGRTLFIKAQLTY